jgi:hypothetical protein
MQDTETLRPIICQFTQTTVQAIIDKDRDADAHGELACSVLLSLFSAVMAYSHDPCEMFGQLMSNMSLLHAHYAKQYMPEQSDRSPNGFDYIKAN